MRLRNGLVLAALCALPLAASHARATTPSEVKGSGIIITSHGAKDGGNYYRHVAVNASVDDAGVAHGHMTWEGDGFQPLPHPSPATSSLPTIPGNFDVTDISFSGTSATVTGVIVTCPWKPAIGQVYAFTFTDNSGSGGRDEIDGVPIHAGSFRVR